MILRRSLLAGSAAALAVPARAADATPVTLAVSSSSLAYGGLRIAQKAGLFEANGLAPAITVLDSGSAALTAVLAGSIEFCSASMGEVLAARTHGQQIVVVANVYRGLSGSLVLAREVADRLGVPASAPIAARLKALDGLTVATPSATSSYTFPFRIAGQAVGGQPRFVYMAQPAMLAALKVGAVQGMIAGAPFSTAAVESGAGVLWVSGPQADLPADVQPTSSAAVETSAAYAAKNPGTIAKVRATFEAAARLITERPQEAERLLASAYPQLGAGTIASIFKTDGANWARPVMTVDDIRHEIGLQQKAGMLKGLEAVDPATLLAP